MLSKAKLQFIISLHQKKYRKSTGLFIAEGDKVVAELLQSSFRIHSVYALSEWFDENSVKLKRNKTIGDVISENDLKKISQLTTPNRVLAIAYVPDTNLSIAQLKNELLIALDDINDPGNFGTIIRTADWFGIKSIVCSTATADAYNSKTVQSAMGSLFRINVAYVDLKKWLSDYKLQTGNRLYGTTLEGKNIYNQKLDDKGVIIIGSESHGINAALLDEIDSLITIPSYSSTGSGAESLNAAVAAGIVLAEFRRGNK
ncbi:MAG: RNA methyltransferase [Bacteroidia bacterium]